MGAKDNFSFNCGASTTTTMTYLGNLFEMTTSFRTARMVPSTARMVPLDRPSGPVGADEEGLWSPIISVLIDVTGGLMSAGVSPDLLSEREAPQ